MNTHASPSSVRPRQLQWTQGLNGGLESHWALGVFRVTQQEDGGFTPDLNGQAFPVIFDTPEIARDAALKALLSMPQRPKEIGNQWQHDPETQGEMLETSAGPIKHLPSATIPGHFVLWQGVPVLHSFDSSEEAATACQQYLIHTWVGMTDFS